MSNVIVVIIAIPKSSAIPNDPKLFMLDMQATPKHVLNRFLNASVGMTYIEAHVSDIEDSLTCEEFDNARDARLKESDTYKIMLQNMAEIPPQYIVKRIITFQEE
jgi:hypothetical protein